MPVEIILLLLAAAVMHAVWNGMIKGADDGVAMASWVYCGSGALLAPALLFLPALPTQGWLLLAAHVSLHMIYKVLLLNMYRLGDFSQVFPVARGTAPAVVTLIAIPVAGELPQPLALLGVATVSAGLVAFALEPRAVRQAGASAFWLAAAAGGTVSLYTVIDALGVRLPGAGLSYFIALFAFDGLGMLALGHYWRGAALWPAMRQCWKAGVPAALLSIANFGIVLWVFSFNPMGPVAAVRETSIVIAALIGTLVFKEGFGRRRIVASLIILAGIALINARG